MRGWISERIVGLDAVVEMPAAGWRLRLADIYAAGIEEEFDAVVARMAEHAATLAPPDATEAELDEIAVRLTTAAEEQAADEAVRAVKDYYREQAGRRRGAEIRARRARAVRGVKSAVATLADLGVTAIVVGSLATGKFGLHSDFDLLITACPHALKYAIEGMVEDALDGMPFDVFYLDELSEWRRTKILESTVDAADLA